MYINFDGMKKILNSRKQMLRDTLCSKWLFLFYCYFADQKSIINICEETVRNSSGFVYLISDDFKESFEECQCFVDSGRFVISVADIRLNDKIENKCSPAKLFVNAKAFLCDKSRSDYGAVFAKKPTKPLHNVFISLLQQSKTAMPDRVLLKLQPESKWQ